MLILTLFILPLPLPLLLLLLLTQHTHSRQRHHGHSIIENRCPHPLYLWLTTHTITTSGLLPPQSIFSQPYHTGYGLEDYPITSPMVDIKVSMEKNAVDANGVSLSVTSSSGASGRGGKKELAGRGVLVLTYGRFRVEDDRTMMFAIGNEVGQPFRGHAVLLNVTGGVVPTVEDDNGDDDDDDAKRRRRFKNATSTRHDGVFWQNGMPGPDEDAYVMRPLDYRDDLRLILCAENPRVLSVFHANAARRNGPTWLSWLWK